MIEAVQCSHWRQRRGKTKISRRCCENWLASTPSPHGETIPYSFTVQANSLDEHVQCRAILHNDTQQRVYIHEFRASIQFEARIDVTIIFKRTTEHNLFGVLVDAFACYRLSFRNVLHCGGELRTVSILNAANTPNSTWCLAVILEKQRIYASFIHIPSMSVVCVCFQHLSTAFSLSGATHNKNDCVYSHLRLFISSLPIILSLFIRMHDACMQYIGGAAGDGRYGRGSARTGAFESNLRLNTTNCSIRISSVPVSCSIKWTKFIVHRIVCPGIRMYFHKNFTGIDRFLFSWCESVFQFNAEYKHESALRTDLEKWWHCFSIVLFCFFLFLLIAELE